MILSFLQGYAAHTVQQVEAMHNSGKLADWLRNRHPKAHGLRTDKALFAYVQDLKNSHLRGADPVGKVLYDSKLHIVRNALGTHTTVSRVQGSQLKAKREIRIASLFKDTPAPFLRMICVHELAHLRERDHNKSFYQLCLHMEPDYHQLEFEVRVYLSYLESGGMRLWAEPNQEESQ